MKGGRGGTGIGVGIALGVALGAAFDNVGVGIAIGIAIGAALDARGYWTKNPETAGEGAQLPGASAGMSDASSQGFGGHDDASKDESVR